MDEDIIGRCGYTGTAGTQDKPSGVGPTLNTGMDTTHRSYVTKRPTQPGESVNTAEDSSSLFILHKRYNEGMHS